MWNAGSRCLRWALIVLTIVPGAAQRANEVVLNNFQGEFPTGANPYAAPIRDTAGNMFGTACAGGSGPGQSGAYNSPPGAGTVYKIDAGNEVYVLHSFSGDTTDGACPRGGLIRDSNGNLYGTTATGGAQGSGIVFTLDSFGRETILYNFTGEADGAEPYAGVVRDAGGNLYGTTLWGGTFNSVCSFGCGVVYKLDPSGNETTLYSFTGGADGGSPYSSVVLDSEGNLYGTASYGGTAGAGVVYKLDPAGNETVLYTFTGGADGGRPYAGVVFDSAGNLYGTASEGGAARAGVVYKLDPAGDETVLYSFTGKNDGANPYAGVVRDAAGNLYGTAGGGSSTACSDPFIGSGCGVVYKLDPSGNETVLYTFTGGVDGGIPLAGVTMDAEGDIWGATAEGGQVNTGVVYQVTAGRETVLYGFQPAAGGYEPESPVISDTAGNLYGATYYGGFFNAGTIYKIDTAGHRHILYSFTGGSDGANPQAGLVLDAAGNLYGTTNYGGSGSGVVYKEPSSGPMVVLHTFGSGADGGMPAGGVTLDATGNLYGATAYGGAAPCLCGIVYKLDHAGNETILHTFTGKGDGKYPSGGVILDSNGSIYGVTYEGGGYYAGTVYKIDPAGNEAILHNFRGAADGAGPIGNLALDSSGNLYGVTYTGGHRYGIVYKLDAAHNETVLHSFTDTAGDGGHPLAGVVLDSDGDLYGTTKYGGAAEFWGTVFEITAAGQEIVLYSFTGGADGGQPEAGLMLDGSGNLYGTTTYGGAAYGGVVFELENATPAARVTP